jgi:hypothetical protein
VHAYMWFLIAGKQISQAKNYVNQSYDHGATARGRITSRRVDQKDEKDSTFVDRKSSQRIYCLIQRKISHSSRVPNRDPELHRPIYNFRFPVIWE